jgi:hypothetical protein
MNLADTETSSMPMFQTASWIYGKAGYDQTHVLTFNVVWDVPKGSKLMPQSGRKVSGILLDNWQISTFTTFASGTPSGIAYTTTDNADITGGAGDGARVIVTGKAPLSVGQRTFNGWFDTTVFARPPKGSPGNAPKDVFRLPGTINWDASLFKNFPLWSERRMVQFRAEFLPPGQVEGATSVGRPRDDDDLLPAERRQTELVAVEIGQAAEWARHWNVPLTCNEFGVYRKASEPQDRARWLHDVTSTLERDGIGWTMWDYSGSFGTVNGKNGEHTADDVTLKALGLKQ